MRKIFLFMVVCCALLLSACQTSSATPKEEAPLTVGIIQISENESFTDMREGFIERMRELGYGFSEHDLPVYGV